MEQGNSGMSEAKTYNPRRFRTTVPYYARYRLGYPESLIRLVVAATGLKPGDAVLDLGCGPGLLAIAFAKTGMRVTAVDPEPDMMAAAGEAAREAGVTLDLHQGSSFDMPKEIGPFKLVTMGRSFHWMDRAATLNVLNGMVAPGGAVALFGDERIQTAENRWRQVLRDTGSRYGSEEESHRRERRSPNFRSHESFLLRSAFSQLERIGIVIERIRTVDDIVGFAFSLSVSSHEKLGERAGAFEKDLRESLAALSPDGRFTEIAEPSALIAKRP
ncbi:MAG TPA: methyltransferase domain-containing protein [Rhizomicrobium sp.]|nr:methyltransferase domain-containing protein [Rhizomicrobium sp.]